MPTSKSSEAALAVKLAAGTQKHLSTLTQVVIGSSTLTPAQIETELQDFAALPHGGRAGRRSHQA